MIPLRCLARSEGRRATDRIEVFAYPERTPEGDLKTLFFARGIRHLAGAADAVSNVRAGDVLDLGGPTRQRGEPAGDADEQPDRTRAVGWVPNYLVDMVHELREVVRGSMCRSRRNTSTRRRHPRTCGCCAACGRRGRMATSRSRHPSSSQSSPEGLWDIGAASGRSARIPRPEVRGALSPAG